ncbi:MAG TPA: hypothetical protein VGY32_11830 [Solirubrobacteraceae bacterium]|nr:hypothetical protein [Solirubrobacteraceae bacterium]
MRRAMLPLLLSLVPIPAGWPQHLALGVMDGPGGAAKLVSHARLDVRYAYLAGGVNTGSGWATWNPNGAYASNYVKESLDRRLIPVFTYYQLLQSKPSLGGDELNRDISNLRDPQTMNAYWADWQLLLRRVSAAGGQRTVVIHVEPDLWGYLQQAGDVSLARQFAQRLLALRNQLAPHVLLAWHLSVWGTREDPTYSKPSLAHMDALAASSASFYRSLRVHFDLVFNDITDRDAGFYKVIEGNPRTAWGPADFRRHDTYIKGFTRRTHLPVVLWQLPLGDTHLNNTWDQFRDNRLQWWLSDPAGRHLRTARDSGVIGLLFGGGAAGTTGPYTDHGFFWGLARRYESRPLGLG